MWVHGVRIYNRQVPLSVSHMTDRGHPGSQAETDLLFVSYYPQSLSWRMLLYTLLCRGEFIGTWSSDFELK